MKTLIGIDSFVFSQNVVMSLKQRLFKLESQLKQKETVAEYVRRETNRP